MKIAIFHNYIDNIGGAEIVSLTLAKELNADIYTTNISQEKIQKMGFKKILPRIFSIGKIPKHSPFKQQMALWKFRKLNLGNKYDFYIIAGDWAMSGLVNNKPNIWYVHSSLNELWAFKDFVKNNLLKSWQKIPYEIFVWVNRKLTLKYSGNVGIWVCNSNNTKKRVKKYYGAEANVINPPINTDNFFYKKSGDFWLSVNRITLNKRIEMQLLAFSKMPSEKLVIVGAYEKGVAQFENYRKYIESIKPANVEIIYWTNTEALVELYSECKGFITTARDEDFGMTPIEAMASGKPVIAPNEGGYKETIIDGATGLLIDDINETKLIAAIKTINEKLKNNPEEYKNRCQKRASEFNIKKFIKKILEASSKLTKKSPLIEEKTS